VAERDPVPIIVRSPVTTRTPQYSITAAGETRATVESHRSMSLNEASRAASSGVAKTESPQAAAYTDRYVEANGLKLHYLDYGGEGRRPMLCLHGSAVNGHWFDFIAGGFTADYHVRALDLRGHGDSASAEPPLYGMPNYAQDVAAFVEKLDLRDFMLVGHSMGGLVSLAYEAKYPGRAKKIVVIDSSMRNTAGRVARFHEVGNREGSSYASKAEYVERFRLRPDGTTAVPEIVRYLAELGAREGPDGRWRHNFDRNVYSKREPFEYLECWDHIRIPALVVRGALSDRITPDIAAEVRRRCPHVEMVEVANSNHHVTLDNPSGFIAAVKPFLDRTDS
jgi:pimeloyl-ACP methyl ester carboxylesterase